MLPTIQEFEGGPQQWLAEFEKDIKRWKTSKASYRWRRLLEDLVMMGVADPTKPNKHVPNPLEYNQAIWELLTKYAVSQPLAEMIIKNMGEMELETTTDCVQGKTCAVASTTIFSNVRYAIDLLEYFFFGDAWRRS